MNHRLKPYPAYKDSGVLWLGEVPEHWDIKPIGRLGFLLKGRGRSKADEIPQGKPCIRYGDLYTQHEYHINQTRAFISKESACYYTPIEYGDILFAASGETIEDIGRSAVNLINSETFCGGDVLLFRPKIEFIPRYLGYASDSPASRHQKACMGKGFTVIHIYGSQLRGLTVPIPPLPEQSTIVRYLDYMDRRIQRYIRAKQKLIKLLEEQKQAIIHQSVTGRIDVRTGKPYPAYKPSGVEWLGDVPEHWEVNPLGRVLMQRKERNDPIKTTNILSLSLKTGVIPYADKEAGGNKAKEDLSAYMLAYPGDIVVNSMNVVVGSVGISKYFGAVSPVYYMLRPRDPYDPVDYTGAIFQNTGFQRSLFGLGNGIMYIESKTSGKLNTIRLRIPMTRLKKVMLPRPPSEEQSAIVRHLFKVISESTAALESTESQIVLLHEFRTRLISDVVTGKLDVREAAANLPDELEEDLLEDQEQEEETDEDLEDGQQTGDEE